MSFRYVLYYVGYSSKIECNQIFSESTFCFHSSSHFRKDALYGFLKYLGICPNKCATFAGNNCIFEDRA